jgi:hypothetical protein
MLAPALKDFKQEQTRTDVTDAKAGTGCEEGDIHDYQYRFRGCLQRLEDENFTTEDKELIRSYLEYSQAQGVGYGRQFKLA